MIRLACADNTFRLVQPWEAAVELIRLLDLDAVDVCLMGNRSHIRPEDVRDDIPGRSASDRVGSARSATSPSPTSSASRGRTSSASRRTTRTRTSGSVPDALFRDMLELADTNSRRPG